MQQERSLAALGMTAMPLISIVRQNGLSPSISTRCMMRGSPIG